MGTLTRALWCCTLDDDDDGISFLLLLLLVVFVCRPVVFADYHHLKSLVDDEYGVEE